MMMVRRGSVFTTTTTCNIFSLNTMLMFIFT
jgi:hypothetical protein